MAPDLVAVSSPPAHAVRSLCVCGQSIFTGGEDGVVLRWALQPLAPFSCLLGHTAPVVALVPLPSLLSSYENGCACVVRSADEAPAPPGCR